MKTCPVTVILPAFNAVDTFSLALKSAAFQTLPPAEIIVLDDGSTDNTRGVIERTIKAVKAETPSNIRLLIFYDNHGVYRLRNEALRQATQPYIAFLDSDDYWHPQKLEIQYGFFERDPHLELCCHALRCRPEGPEGLPPYPPGYRPLVKPLKAKHVLFRNIIVTITVMIKKQPGMFFDEQKRRGSDMLYWLEIVLKGGKAIWLHDMLSFTAKPLYGAGGLTRSIWKAEQAQQNNLYMLYKRGYISWPYSAFLRAFSFAKMLRRYFVFYLRGIRRDIGKSSAARAKSPAF